MYWLAALIMQCLGAGRSKSHIIQQITSNGKNKMENQQLRKQSSTLFTNQSSFNSTQLQLTKAKFIMKCKYQQASYQVLALDFIWLGQFQRWPASGSCSSPLGSSYAPVLPLDSLGGRSIPDQNAHIRIWLHKRLYRLIVRNSCNQDWFPKTIPPKF